MGTKDKLILSPAEEYSQGFGFERALILMREGKQVRQVRSPKIFEIRDNKIYCDNNALVAIGIGSIVEEKWCQV